MNIRYKYVGYADNIKFRDDGRRGVRPLVIHNENLDSSGIADLISSMNFYSRPDAVKAVEAVFTVIEQSLREGRSVTVDGFGTFLLTAQFAEGVDPVEARRAESIEVKSVVFRATKGMKGRIGRGRFKRLNDKM